MTSTFVKTTSFSAGPERDYLYYWQLWHHNWDDSDIALVEALCKPSGANILEVGCGDGRVAFALEAHCERLTAIDLDERFIQIARQRQMLSGSSKLTFTKMNAEHLEFPDDYFDVVLYPWVLQMVGHPQAALSEAHRVLKPRGRLLVLGLRSDADYDRIIERFVRNTGVIDAVECYEKPILKAFGKIEQIIAPDRGLGFSYFFESLAVAYDAFLFALKRWYKAELNDAQKAELAKLLGDYVDGERVHLRFPATIYLSSKK